VVDVILWQQCHDGNGELLIFLFQSKASSTICTKMILPPIKLQEALVCSSPFFVLFCVRLWLLEQRSMKQLLLQSWQFPLNIRWQLHRYVRRKPEVCRPFCSKMQNV